MEQFFVGFETLAKLYGSLAEANMFFYGIMKMSIILEI